MAAAHSYTWHGTRQSLLEAKLAAIAKSRSCVRMETFIFRDMEISRWFRDTLTVAARRRLRVWLMVAPVGSFVLRRDYFDEVIAAGGPMQRLRTQ